MPQMIRIGVALLAAFGAAAKQNNERVAIFGKVDPVTWTPVDNVFTHAVKPLDTGRIAQFHANFGNGYLGSGLC